MKQLYALVKRHFKCFFKTQTNFFFALMVPVCSILIYLIFLRSLEQNSVMSLMQQVIQHPSDSLINAAYGLVDAWMLSGIIGLTCITVSLNTCYVVLKDREQGVVKDFASSPIKNRTLISSYMIFNFLVTFVIVMLIYFICIAILACYKVFVITSFLNFLLSVCAIIVGIIVSSLLTFFIINFFSNNDSFNSVIAIFSAGAGFVIGTYMPLSMLSGFAVVSGFLPGTYSVALLRKLFLESQYNNVMATLEGIPEGPQVIEKINSTFTWDVKFCNMNVKPEYFWLVLAGFIVLFGLINLIFTNHNMQVRLLGKPQRQKKVKKAA